MLPACSRRVLSAIVFEISISSTMRSTSSFLMETLANSISLALRFSASSLCLVSLKKITKRFWYSQNCKQGIQHGAAIFKIFVCFFFYFPSLGFYVHRIKECEFQKNKNKKNLPFISLFLVYLHKITNKCSYL